MGIDGEVRVKPSKEFLKERSYPKKMGQQRRKLQKRGALQTARAREWEVTSGWCACVASDADSGLNVQVGAFYSRDAFPNTSQDSKEIAAKDGLLSITSQSVTIMWQ